MADEKPVTKSELVATLKEAGFATKDDLREFGEEIRQQVREDAFVDRTEFFVKMTKPEIGKLREETRVGFREVNKRLTKVEAEVSFVKDDIKGLTADLSAVPKREEITQLTTRIRKLEIARGDL